MTEIADSSVVADSLKEAVERVLDRIDATQEDLVQFLQQLVAYRTESQDPESEHFLSEADACREFMASFIRADGFETEQWDAAARSFPRHPVLAGHLPGAGEGRSIALNGHFDVVPAGRVDAWSFDPWGQDIVSGRLYGRGTADMKGGIAAMLWAVRSLRGAGIRLQGSVWTHLVSDEEVVGFGSRECVERLPRVDGVIDPEPSAMAIMPATGGLEHLRIEIEGVAAHAGVRYQSVHAGGGAAGGVNAIEKMVKVLTALQELERQWAVTRAHELMPSGFNTIQPGIIAGANGGGSDGQVNMITNPGTAPDYCSLEYNIWYYPHETLDNIRNEISDYIGAVCATDPWLTAHPPKLTWALRGVSFPPVDTKPSDPLVDAMKRAVAAVNVPVEVRGATYATDVSWYQAQGIPGLAFAAGSIDQAHSPNEYVDVAKLVDATRALSVFLVEWCGVV
jgi:acetylornithine deacetylase/succinyl-diaminopimelate desuccinylase family protein